MEELFLTSIIILAILIPIAFCLWLVYISYSIPTKSGQKKTGIILSSIVSLVFLFFAVNIFFEDELFSKNNARDLLNEQNVVLNDNFEILKNESMSAIGDYYHTFSLKISEKDKMRIIDEIKQSKNFNLDKETQSYSDNRKDYYNGPKRIKNYETENHFIRELFEPQGENYAPTWRKIEIDKNENKLIFEDIDE
jgi:hypothetical protein